jgi:hypothetical protein
MFPQLFFEEGFLFMLFILTVEAVENHQKRDSPDSQNADAYQAGV